MENRVPAFAGGRILKKERLWDIRDYLYGGWQLYYAGYTDGLLQGCRIRAEEKELVIERGMIKFHGVIYKLREESRIPYSAEDRWVALKAIFETDTGHPDYSRYSVRFFTDRDLVLRENELEMCRYYLRSGSRLRDSYKGLYDMVTEYDTINLIHASVAGPGQASLHPRILETFAQELWGNREKEPADYAFCFTIWDACGAVSRKTLGAYLTEKRQDDRGEGIREYSNQELYEGLEEIAGGMARSRRRKREHRTIIVE